MKILDKLKAIFFGGEKEEEKAPPKPQEGNSCYWCETYFQPGEYQKKFNKKWFHRRCYKSMIKSAKKDLGLATT